MKKILLLSLSFATFCNTWAQTNTKPKVVKKTVPAVTNSLKNTTDSASYAMGISLASFYKQQGIKTINTALVSKAINDVMGNKKPLLDEFAANEVMNKLMTGVQEKKSKSVIEAGNAFLAENKKKPGVKVTASGLQYEVITEGTGIKPTAVDTFVAHYRGSFIDGKEFEASYNSGQPLVYPVNKVIAGWTEGLQMMPVGSKYKFYIPYQLGYGTFDNGPIPGGSVLIFELELLDVKKHE